LAPPRVCGAIRIQMPSGLELPAFSDVLGIAGVPAVQITRRGERDYLDSGKRQHRPPPSAAKNHPSTNVVAHAIIASNRSNPAGEIEQLRLSVRLKSDDDAACTPGARVREAIFLDSGRTQHSSELRKMHRLR